MIKPSICGKEEFEEEDAKHISVKHGFENPQQYQYLASLERRIKALEDRSSNGLDIISLLLSVSRASSKA